MPVPKWPWRIWSLALFAAVAVIAATGLSYETFGESRDAARFPPPGRLVDVGGRRLHLLCKGSAPGPTVIMVAGGGTPAVVSYDLQDRIAKFARVCSYDRAGLGWSDPARHALTFAEQVNDLETLLQNAKLAGPYVFVPESFGSLIVIDFAQRYPGQVAGVVFLDGVDPQLWFKAMVDQSGSLAEFKNLAVKVAWRTGIVRLAFPALAPAWVWRLPAPIRDQMVAIYARPSAGYAEALDAYTISPQRPYLAPGALGTRPVIALRHGKTSDALSGEFEAGWQASQTRLAQLPHNGIVITAAGADHEIAQEQPELAAQWVQKALSETRRQ